MLKIHICKNIDFLSDIIEQRIKLKNTYLEYRKLLKRPKLMHIPVVALTKQKPQWKPPKDHPWKKFNF